jgi:hypothetical protein
VGAVRRLDDRRPTSIILVGGLLITLRPATCSGMSAAFCSRSPAGIGILAASGHCMTGTVVVRAGLRGALLVG